jgi:hypothetical protein
MEHPEPINTYHQYLPDYEQAEQARPSELQGQHDDYRTDINTPLILFSDEGAQDCSNIPDKSPGVAGETDIGDGSKALARTSDQRFDVLAGNPVTDSQRERGTNFRNLAVYSWLGHDHGRPALLNSYDLDHVPTSEQPITLEDSEKMVDYQLSRFTRTYNATLNGIQYSDALHEHIAADLYTRIVSKEETIIRPTSHPVQIGQYNIHANEEGAIITNADIPDTFQLPLLCYKNSDTGEVRLIHPDSTERYIVTGGAGFAHIVKESLHVLRDTIPQYLKDLTRLLTTQKELLEHVAETAGIDIEMYADPKTGRMPVFGQQASELNKAAERATPIIEPNIRYFLNITARDIFEAIREQRTYHPETDTVSLNGLEEVKRQVERYYRKLATAR